MERAEEILRKVLEKQQQNAEANFCLGKAMFLRRLNPVEARKTLERAQSLNPQQAEYGLWVGRAALEAGDDARAKEVLEKALQQDKSLADAYWLLGELLQRQGSAKDAIKLLNRALSLSRRSSMPMQPWLAR